MAAAAPVMNLALEPTFHGTSHPPGQAHLSQQKAGLSAEDFVRRMVSARAAQALTTQAAAALAIGYLRDSAARWYSDTLSLLVDPATYDRIGKDFDLFLQYFKAEWFVVRQAKDLSIDWSQLRQTEAESAADFTRRAAGSLSAFNRLFPICPVPTAPHEALVAAINAYHAEPTEAHKAAVLTAIISFHEAGQTSLKAALVSDIVIKILGAGLRSPKLRELVRREENRSTPLADIVQLIREGEQAMGPLPQPGTAALETQSGPAHPAPSSAAVGRSGSAGPSAAGNRGGRHHRSRTGRVVYDPSKPPPSACPRCKQMGHWMRDCPVPPRPMPPPVPPPMPFAHSASLHPGAPSPGMLHLQVPPAGTPYPGMWPQVGPNPAYPPPGAYDAWFPHMPQGN